MSPLARPTARSLASGLMNRLSVGGSMGGSVVGSMVGSAAAHLAGSVGLPVLMPVLMSLAMCWGLAMPAPAHAAGEPSAKHTVGKVSKANKAAKPRSKTTKAAKAVIGQNQPVRSDSDPDTVTYGQREDVLALADELAERHGLAPAWARAQLAQARYQPAVARLIMPPPAGTAKNWAAYRARFIEPDRLRAGVAFWSANLAWLDAAEQRYGVPAAVVVGIIGVETFYGRVTGNFRVLDALATLSLDFPKGRKDRSAFFRDELGQFLRLVQTEQLVATAVKGSFAGAIGLGQFMPGSINRFAVDFDGNGHIDMAAGGAGSVPDAIGSVARYLAEHGWQRSMATHYPVKPPVDSSERAALLAPDILPSFSAAQMTERGAELDAAGAGHSGPLALVELQNGDAAPSYVAGTQNFYALTRYNWSSYYALAVIELGQAVASVRNAAR